MDFEILPAPGRWIGRTVNHHFHPNVLSEFREELWRDRGSVDDFWASDKFGRSVCSSCGMAHGHSVYCRRELDEDMALALEILDQQVRDLEHAGDRRAEIQGSLFWLLIGITLFVCVFFNLMLSMRP